MVLQLDRLTKTYGSQTALNACSVQIERGQVFGILGPNGSGKTTALGMVLGVTMPTAGTFGWFGGQGVDAMRGRVGALLERPDYLPWNSAWQHLQLVAYARGVPAWEDAAAKALQSMSLWEHRHKMARSFSLGMQQRLALASCLLGDPEVLVLDEPTNGIDAQGISDVRQLIRNWAHAGKTVIMASHILDEVEKVCSHVLVLSKGRTLECGPIRDVLSTTSRVEVAALDMGGLRHVLQDMLGAAVPEPDHHFLVSLPASMTHSEFAQHLHRKGCVVTHLRAQAQTLEDRFLQLVADDRGAA